MDRIMLSPAVARIVTKITLVPDLDHWHGGEPDPASQPAYAIGVVTPRSGQALHRTADLAGARRLATDLADRLGVPLDDMTAGGA